MTANQQKNKSPEFRFIHRDISWLSFNERVLEEAADSTNPLIERINFLAIFANNLDEFLSVRVAGLRRLIDSRYNQKDQFGWYPQDVYAQIRERIAVLDARAYEYMGVLFRELAKHKIVICSFDNLAVEQKKYCRAYFESTLFPIITPMAIDPGRPFPVLPSKTTAFAVSMARYTSENVAIIPIPKSTPRVLSVAGEGDEQTFVLIDDIIRAYLDTFFKGFKITAAAMFRVIRDSELSIDEEYESNLLKALEGELKKRPKAKVVSVYIEKNCPALLLDTLVAGLAIPRAEVCSAQGSLGLSYLFEFAQLIRKPSLRYPGFSPSKVTYDNIFERIAEGDFLIHVPYQSFQPTIDFIQEAARDPSVLAIKMTLYRTDEGSAIIAALKSAAKHKKQVTILLEIKARFDEERNIDWARDLEAAGCHVMYGLAGMKVHSKIALVVRREQDRIRRYVHISSGNYNEKTAQVYTDTGYFTAHDDFARDISELFNAITGYSIPSRWKRIVAAPFTMRAHFMELIDKEIEYQKIYKNGFIFAKMNSLEDVGIADKLYEASCAGVTIRLLVRGMCIIVPGIAGLSQHIEVRSVIGRFLEHSRVYMFNNNNTPRVYIGSADWMTRNFDRRIELLAEIQHEQTREYLCGLLDAYWKDDCKAWHLRSNRGYSKPVKNGEFRVQEHFLKLHGV